MKSSNERYCFSHVLPGVSTQQFTISQQPSEWFHSSEAACMTVNHMSCQSRWQISDVSRSRELFHSNVKFYAEKHIHVFRPLLEKCLFFVFLELSVGEHGVWKRSLVWTEPVGFWGVITTALQYQWEGLYYTQNLFNVQTTSKTLKGEISSAFWCIQFYF